MTRTALGKTVRRRRDRYVTISSSNHVEADNLGYIELADTIADSYARTLHEWRRRFNARRDAIAALGFDDRFRRIWNFYLAASAAGFASGAADVVQVAYARES